MIKNDHDQGKHYKTLSKQLDVSVTKVADIIMTFKVHGTVVILPGVICFTDRKRTKKNFKIYVN